MGSKPTYMKIMKVWWIFIKIVFNLPVPKFWKRDHLGVLPHSGRLFVGFLAGTFFLSRITHPWNFRPHSGDFRIIQRRRGISPEVGSTNFQPVMFDMDPFGGKKVSYFALFVETVCWLFERKKMTKTWIQFWCFLFKKVASLPVP